MDLKELINLEKALSLIMSKPPVTKISILEKIEIRGTESAGLYDSKTDTIYLTKESINDRFHSVISLAHESRHSYQHSVIKRKNKNKSDYSLREIWEKESNPKNYKYPEKNQKTIEETLEYSCQNIEIDAIAFSLIIAEIIFKKIPGFLEKSKIDSKVYERREKIAKKLNIKAAYRILNKFSETKSYF